MLVCTVSVSSPTFCALNERGEDRKPCKYNRYVACIHRMVTDLNIPIEIVGRFLALLELYRTRAVAFEQPEPLGVLQVSWTGGSPTEQQLHEPEDES